MQCLIIKYREKWHAKIVFHGIFDKITTKKAIREGAFCLLTVAK